MIDFKKLLLIPMIAGSLAITGCGGDDHSDHDDHDHEEYSDDDGHGHNEEGGDEHSAEHGLAEITIAGSVFDIAVGGEPGPNVTLHIHIKLDSGPAPVAIRVWVGNEAATGSVKGKAFGSDGKYHADATCPAELTDDAALWIEVESADGTKTAGSVPLEHGDA